ncbi:MAG TPA: hypothetical protein VFH30_03515 [Acidimicrobiales bacterium]|nr:hypothetical protein [Acidimicrobiales bacterium]
MRLKFPAQLRDQQLRVRFHGPDGETERRAWTVHGVDPTEVIVLDETDTPFCDAMEFAVAWPGGYSAFEAMLQHLSVTSTPT